MADIGGITLVATDLDGTLLRDDGSVGERTKAAITSAREAGIAVVPITARQPIGMRHIDAGFRDWAVCSNGALGIHLSSGEVLFEDMVQPAILQQLVAALDTSFTDVRLAAIGSQGQRFLAGPGYAQLTAFDDHKRDPATMQSVSLTELVAEPCLKLCVREPGVPAAATLTKMERLDIAGITVTRSGAPFVEISAAGVTKGSGLARLCTELGIERTSVIAVGDAPNDIAMLTWAGRAVAVGNAEPAVKDVADTVIGSNDDEAVAGLLEGLAAAR